MKVAVRYYTETGNTKKIAEEVAKVAGVEALPVSEPLTEDVDVLFLANAVYAAGVAKEITECIENINVKVGEIVNISSAALMKSSYSQVKKIVEKNGLKMSRKEYHCRGQFKMIHKGRPNDEDMQKAREFTKEYLASRS